MEVCFAVRMRLVAADGDVMNRNWNAMTLEKRRLQGGEGRRCAICSGKKRAKKCGGVAYYCAVMRLGDMQPRTYHSKFW
ncbi:hypothetical protein IQ06DRAFT_143203 [Phaeosphaeriaceae sp. SRC1lsM3a]|nr:hypothetical protein IQ06DRAFT_143203 [Stagonospora sp. SRC1lsM3a]